MRQLLITFLCISSFTSVSLAQRTYYGVFGESAINYKLKNNWKLTAKIESQHRLFSNTELIENLWEHEHVRSDFQGFVGKGLTVRTKGAIGYQYRWSLGGQNSHRIIEQISWLSNVRNYRIGHRVRTDQTFLNDKVSWRLRYRISADLPINGQQLDPGEKYLILSEELIGEYFDEELALENRIVAGLGWYFENKHKLEVGIDYRLDPIITSPQRNRIWTKVSFYWNF